MRKEMTMKDSYYEGKVAVVTGGGGLLSSVLAKDLAQKGAKIALLDLRRENAQNVADEIEAAGGTVKIWAADVTDEQAMTEIAEEIKSTLGPCRFLLNGAGGNQNKAITTNFYFDPAELEEHDSSMVGFFDLDMDIFANVLRINTIGTVIPSRVFGRQMAAAHEGAIINFASMNSYRPLTRVPAYAMSKAAIVNWTQWLATYFASAGIRVNGVAPGFFINDRSIKILGSPETGLTQRGQNVINHLPMQRFGSPEELVGCISWLLDDRAAAYVTGITVPVDGGFLAHPGI